jgi:hypothetical protein
MKMRRTVWVVLAAVLLLFLGDWAFTRGPFGYYYPTEETKSEFLKKYTEGHLREVMKPFISMTQDVVSGSSAGAGRKFVSNERTIEPYVAIRPQMVFPMMVALRDDLSTQLTHEGAKLISETDDSPDRIRFTYRLGQNIGSASLSLSITNSRAAHYTQTGAMVEPPKGAEYMIVSIAITEKWFPKEEKALRASLETP